MFLHTTFLSMIFFATLNILMNKNIYKGINLANHISTINNKNQLYNKILQQYCNLTYAETYAIIKKKQRNEVEYGKKEEQEEPT